MKLGRNTSSSRELLSIETTYFYDKTRYSVADQVCRDLDLDGDGVIEFLEFKRMMLDS